MLGFGKKTKEKEIETVRMSNWDLFWVGGTSAVVGRAATEGTIGLAKLPFKVIGATYNLIAGSTEEPSENLEINTQIKEEKTNNAEVTITRMTNTDLFWTSGMGAVTGRAVIEGSTSVIKAPFKAASYLLSEKEEPIQAPKKIQAKPKTLSNKKKVDSSSDSDSNSDSEYSSSEEASSNSKAMDIQKIVDAHKKPILVANKRKFEKIEQDDNVDNTKVVKRTRFDNK